MAPDKVLGEGLEGVELPRDDVGDVATSLMLDSVYFLREDVWASARKSGVPENFDESESPKDNLGECGLSAKLGTGELDRADPPTDDLESIILLSAIAESVANGGMLVPTGSVRP